MSVLDLLQFKVLEHPLTSWGVFLLVFLAAFTVMLWLRNKAIARVTARNNNHIPSGWDTILEDVISNTRIYALIALALYLASLTLDLNDSDHHGHAGAVRGVGQPVDHPGGQPRGQAASG
jgi:putative copper export protein